MQKKHVINPKTWDNIKTTSTTFIPITNVTLEEENIWNANSDVMKNKFGDVYKYGHSLEKITVFITFRIYKQTF